jgi:hypothetical protein
MQQGEIRSELEFRYSDESGYGASIRLIDKVAAACERLADQGWHDLLAAHGLDIKAADLAAELARPLSVDRTQPGFEDFALEGGRAIEPGMPAHSLLYHAFASPRVRSFVKSGTTVSLEDFPTAAELDSIENYVYGAIPPSIEDIRARAGRAQLAVAVFASEYRSATETVHRRHADTCYSRTGISRIGMRAPDYRKEFRGYATLRPGDGKSMAVLPVRYSAYIAALLPAHKEGHGPMHFVEPKTRPAAGTAHGGKNAGPQPADQQIAAGETSDSERQFWVPLHKLFDGDECLRGYSLNVGLSANHRNEKLRRAHMFFGSHGHDGGWHEPDISKPPFVIKDGIAEFSDHPEDPPGLLVPVPREHLVEPAIFRCEPLWYNVPTPSTAGAWETYQSSLNLIAPNDDARKAPEYLHARHALHLDGKEVNLNQKPEIEKIVSAGNYRARHYVDYTGDGWIAVECSALALEIPRRLPAFSIVSCPDYFPGVRQSDLTEWTDQSAPPKLLEAVWPENPGRPEPLSSQRIAANLELHDAGFDREDDTMTVIVGACGSGSGAQMRLLPADYARASMLPDGAAGVFAPGWDASYDRTIPNPSGSEREAKGITFLANYGLGSPFPEDAMLCAALSSFWPAVAPDITRTFAPTGRYHSATPLTDDAIGLGSEDPWDGIKGPVPGPDDETVDYKKLAYGDYVEAMLEGRFDLTAIADLKPEEYIARTLTTAMVYEALEVRGRFEKAKWAILSFRLADPQDQDLIEVSASLGRRLNPEHSYRFEMIRHDNQTRVHPTAFDRTLVGIKEKVVLFADPTVVLRCPAGDQEASLYARSL